MPSNYDLAPVSWASTIIGFVSFAFTVFTFIKVILGNLRTLVAAPQEVSYSLSNLKQELFEERLHLRRARRRAERYMRHCRRDGKGIPSWDSAPAIRLLENTVRQLYRDFKVLERPFLIDPRHQGAGGKNGLESGPAKEAEEWTDYIHGGFEQDYGAVTIYHRFSWLRRKAAVHAMAHNLERLQIRRIGRETTDALTEIKNMKAGMQDLKLIPDSPHAGTTTGGATARRRRTSQKTPSRPADSYSTSRSSESSVPSDAEMEKLEKVHVRRSSTQRR